MTIEIPKFVMATRKTRAELEEVLQYAPKDVRLHLLEQSDRILKAWSELLDADSLTSIKFEQFVGLYAIGTEQAIELPMKITREILESDANFDPDFGHDYSDVDSADDEDDEQILTIQQSKAQEAAQESLAKIEKELMEESMNLLGLPDSYLKEKMPELSGVNRPGYWNDWD